jgi:uncharacterized protein (DUF58 family)
VRYRAGDFLGLTQRLGGETDVQELLVLPKVFALAVDPAGARTLCGTAPARPPQLLDPLRVLGARDYRSGDPLRSIDWRATARRTSLMVREVEPSTTPLLQIILNFQVRSAAGDRVEPDELEFAVSVAASLAAFASRRGVAVGLCGNGCVMGKALALPASRAHAHLGVLMETLARVTSRPLCPLASLLRERIRVAMGASTWLLVTDHLDHHTTMLLTDAQRRGQSIVVVSTARDDSSLGAHGALRVVRFPYHEGWWQRETLSTAA